MASVSNNFNDRNRQSIYSYSAQGGRPDKKKVNNNNQQNQQQQQQPTLSVLGNGHLRGRLA